MGAALFNRMLVAFDGSPTSSAALAVAIGLADVLKATIRVVSVVERLPEVIGLGGGLERAPENAQMLHSESEKALSRARDFLKFSGVHGDTLAIDAGEHSVATVLNLAAREWQADVIISGTHGRRGARRLVLGSVADALVKQSTLPVILVPHYASKNGRAEIASAAETKQSGGH